MIRRLLCRLLHRGVYMDCETIGITGKPTRVGFCCKQCGRTWQYEYPL